MADSLTVLDALVRGVAIGALAMLAFGFLRDGASRQARLVVPVTSLSIGCWLIVESPTLWAALGSPVILVPWDAAVGGLFWLLVLTVFDDRRLSVLAWAPAGLLVAACSLDPFVGPQVRDWLWAGRNIFSGLLCLHAALVIGRGWSGDLLEGRRRLRVLVLGFTALLAVTNVLFAFAGRLDPAGPWRQFMINAPIGGGLFAVLIVAGAALFLQASPAMLGQPRRPAQRPDPRAEAADRVTLQELNAFMAKGGWRREGLTIGAVARELGVPEHRLRRLINQRLSHRNFADFVNGHRIDAAKARLADPLEARTTVAAIAFDLGYGSLGPFNRAFRAATGVTPTEWRRQALQASPELQEAV